MVRTVDHSVVAELRALDDDGDFLRQLIETFRAEFEATLSTFGPPGKLQQRDAWRDTCHAARSLAGSVGALALQEAAGRAMANPPESAQDAATYVSDIEREFAAASEGLAAYLDAMD